MSNSVFERVVSPFLHGGQLDPAVESGIIAADKIGAVLSWKTGRIGVTPQLSIDRSIDRQFL